jgi:PLP dependent protein
MSEGEVDMKIDTARAKALNSQLQAVSERIGKVAAGRNVCHLIRSPPFEPASTRALGGKERRD